MIFKNCRKKIYELCGLLIFFLFLLGFLHLWVTDRFAIYRFLYPVESLLTRPTVNCSQSTPSWVRDIVLDSLKTRALANQIAYISPEGRQFYCNSGWLGGFLKGDRVDFSTRFRYASTTKIITADLILSLVKDGRIRLDSTVEELFPEILSYKDERVRAITVEQLLNHTAGFNRVTSGDPMFSFKKKPWCPYDIHALSSLRLTFSPGMDQVYANLGYCLLGVIAERATSISYRDLLEQRYQLSKIGILFLNGPLLHDEVVPDFRNDSFYTVNYYKYYDFFAVSSAAGLSGSASSLASLVAKIYSNSDFSLHAQSSYIKCDSSQFRKCFGYAFYKYQKSPNNLSVYIQEGYLHGASSVVFSDSEGGVLVLLSAGRSKNAAVENKKIYKKIYGELVGHYHDMR